MIRDFEGLDVDRAIRAAGGRFLCPARVLGLVLPEAPPDHSTTSRTRRLIGLETREAVFTWICGASPTRAW
jgi:transposase